MQHLLNRSVWWVHVVMSLLGDGLVNLLVPIRMQFTASLVFMILALPQSHGRAVCQIVSASDVFKKTFETIFASLVPLLHDLKHVLEVALTLAFYFAQFGKNLGSFTLLWRESRLIFLLLHIKSRAR